MLNDNGGEYLSGSFNDYEEMVQIGHLFAARFRRQRVGKFERLNRTAKTKLGLVIYARRVPKLICTVWRAGRSQPLGFQWQS